MTSSASVATWLPAATAGPAVRTARPDRTAPPARTVPTGGRHRAPEIPGPVTFATPRELVRKGRHSEQQRSREVHELPRDGVDPLTWLGFVDAH